MSSASGSPRKAVSGHLAPRVKYTEELAQLKTDLKNAAFICATDHNVSTLPVAAHAPGGLYVDLEGNQLPSESLSKLGRKLACLNLAKNPLGNCKLPALSSLRSLSLDGCGLTSLRGIPALPELRYLSAARNRLSSYDGLRIFPRLVSVNFEGNAIDFSRILTLQAVGSVFVRTINNVDLTEREIRSAFLLSPLVGHALRQGRDPAPRGSPDEEVAASRDFLTRDLVAALTASGLSTAVLSLVPTPLGDGHAFVLPWEATSVKWLRTTAPRSGADWGPVLRDPDDASPPNILPLTHCVRRHLVRCDFSLSQRVFSVYTDWPLGREPRELSLPFPLDQGIDGLPTEGALISMKPLIVPARADWVSRGESIGRDRPSIVLSAHEVGDSVTCFIEPYCPHFPGIVFGVVFAETDVVEPRVPVVSEISFPALLIEGEKVTFTRTLIPDAEGASEVAVERSTQPSLAWTPAAELSPRALEYTPTADDVGAFLRLSYTPVARTGQRGATVYSYSEGRVRSCLPAFDNPVIGGFPKTNFQLCALADYRGGRKGHCTFNWFFARVPFTRENFKRGELVAADSVDFTPRAEHAGGFLAVEMVPVRCDGVVGETVVAALPKPLLRAEPTPPLPNPPAAAVAGTRIDMGETVSFMLSSTSAFCGFTEVRRGQSFTPAERHVGQILRIITDECDHVVGEVRPAIPVCSRVAIACRAAEVGVAARAEIDPPSLFPEQCEVIWIKAQGPVERAVAFGTTEYTFGKEDIGFAVRVRVTPVARDGALQAPTDSAVTAPVQPAQALAPAIRGSLVELETVEAVYARDADEIAWLRSARDRKWRPTGVKGPLYHIRSADLGHYLRAQLTVGGSTLIATSADVVQPRPPSVQLADPALARTEGDLLAPQATYVGGKEGASVLAWTRVKNGEREPLGAGPTYRVAPHDAGAAIEFSYTPVRSDKRAGAPAVLTYEPIAPRPPTVKNVRLVQNAEGNVELLGEYSGGVSDSRFEWALVIPPRGARPERTRKLQTTTLPSFRPPPEFAGCQIEGTFVPVRRDGVRGTPVTAPARLTVRPLPAVQSAELRAEAGAFRCVAVVPDGTARFQWERLTPLGQWELIKDATDSVLRPVREEITAPEIRCVVTPVNAAGWLGAPVDAVVPASAAGEQAFAVVSHKNRFQSGVELTTTAAGPVTWEREVDGEWGVAAEEKARYRVTWNDVGHRIRAFLGERETPPTPAVVLRPALNSYLRACVRARTFKVTLSARLGKGAWVATATAAGLSLKGTGGEKVARWETVRYAVIEDSDTEMVLWLDPSSKFVVMPTFPGDQRLTDAVREHTRDFVCAVLSEYAKGVGPGSP